MLRSNCEDLEEKGRADKNTTKMSPQDGFCFPSDALCHSSIIITLLCPLPTYSLDETMIGFSLSPGGLLLPYHVGVLGALEYQGFLTPESPIAGSSAGSIATVAHAAGIRPEQVLDASIRLSEKCESVGGARGNLLPLLREEMGILIDEERFEQLQNRKGLTGVCYRELFPRNVPVLQTEFQDYDDMVKAVCHSCTFPFFSTNFPVAFDFDAGGWWPRVVVDGFFAVPRERFGCPDFEQMVGLELDRTITISAIPHHMVGLNASEAHDQISPSMDADFNEFIRLATKVSSPKELTHLYELGWKDGEEWCSQERKR